MHSISKFVASQTSSTTILVQSLAKSASPLDTLSEFLPPVCMFPPNMLHDLVITPLVIFLAIRNKALIMPLILRMLIILAARKAYLVLSATRVVLVVVRAVGAFAVEPKLAIAALFAVVYTMDGTWR